MTRDIRATPELRAAAMRARRRAVRALGAPRPRDAPRIAPARARIPERAAPSPAAPARPGAPAPEPAVAAAAKAATARGRVERSWLSAVQGRVAPEKAAKTTPVT